MKTLLLFLVLFLADLAHAQNVNIPDPVFKAFLVGEMNINTNGDSEIQVSEASAYTGIIDCAFYGISDLTGIEAFTALTTLYCHNNSLTSLNVSMNIALNELNCMNNQLTSLDVSQNTALTNLACGGNQLTSIDVSLNTNLMGISCNNSLLTSLDLSQNSALTYCNCNNNQLTSLDVSSNLNLTGLICNSNFITTLDLSQNTALLSLWCDQNELTCLNVKNGNNANMFDFWAYDNPNLTCIEVDNFAWSTGNWTFIDPQMYFSNNCGNACTTGLVEHHKEGTELIKVLDFIGRETEDKPNTLMIYVYSDGTTEKVFRVE